MQKGGERIGLAAIAAASDGAAVLALTGAAARSGYAPDMNGWRLLPASRCARAVAVSATPSRGGGYSIGRPPVTGISAPVM